MSQVCSTCQAVNRDSAKFCHGCAGRLPGFTASGSSALEAMRPLRLPPDSAAPGAGPPPQGLLQVQSRAFWLRLALMALAITLGLVGWYAYVTRPVKPLMPVAAQATRASAPPAAAVTSGAPPAAAVTSDAPLAAAAATRTEDAVRADAAPAKSDASAASLPPARAATGRSMSRIAPADALGPGESLAAANPTTARLPVAPPPAPSVPAVPTELAPLPPGQTRAGPTGSRPVARADADDGRLGAADPGLGCAQLNFVARARCEAAVCARPGYSRHRRCDAVREEARRSEARRLMGF